MYIDDSIKIDEKKLSVSAKKCIDILEESYKNNDGFTFNNELDILESLSNTGCLYDKVLIKRRYGLI